MPNRAPDGIIVTVMASSTEPDAELEALLALLRPEIRPGRFVLVGLASPEIEAEVLGSGACHAWIRESEGLCAVVSEEDALRFDLRYESVWAWITLGVHSDLQAVGLTAAVSGSLARAGLSCNMLAGLHHDHLLVPFEAAEQALASLEAISTVHRDD